MSTCNCNKNDRRSSGGSPYMPGDYTDDYTVHYSYSNWDEYSIFTCNHCGKIWLLENDYVDRPPYLNHETLLSVQQLENFKKINTREIDKLIEKNGIRHLRTIIKECGEIEVKGNLAPEDNG